jgi:hypothetical protein
MKHVNIFLALSILTLPVFSDLSIKSIQKMVKDIRGKRVSKMRADTKIDSPFIVVKQDENLSVAVMQNIESKALKTDFSLGAIINHSAFIDGEWKKKGDIVGEFRVISITDDHVVLKKKNRTITLYFRKAKDILKIGKEQE